MTTGADGKATYKYKQAPSKITHSKFTATVTATAGSGAAANTATTTYKIQFGTIDVSAEPRSIAPGKVDDVFVHAKKGSRVDAFIITPSGRLISLGVKKTGSKGLASFKYKIPKGLVSGHNVKVTVLAKFASGHPSTTTKTTLTIT
jgi:hypothetical protein